MKKEIFKMDNHEIGCLIESIASEYEHFVLLHEPERWRNQHNIHVANVRKLNQIASVLK